MIINDIELFNFVKKYDPKKTSTLRNELGDLSFRQ